MTPATIPSRRRLAGLRRLLLATVVAFAAGCGAGAGDPVVAAAAPVEVQGRVALAAIGECAVVAYRLGDYTAPVATTTASAGTAELGGVGTFALTLPPGPAEAVYVLVASGGTAHDPEEDGVLDGSRANRGRVHAVGTAADLARRTVLLSSVSEVVFQRVSYFLAALYDDAYVARACDACAGFVLRTNVAGAPGISNEDALAFDPRLHRASVYRTYDWSFLPIVNDLVEGRGTLAKALAVSREEIRLEPVDGECRGIAVVGDVAYVCRGAGGLSIYDVGDPTDIAWLSAFDTPGTASEVQVVGNLAYVADGTGGLRIVNVANPRAPVPVGSAALAGPVVSLHVVGDRCYLCSDGASPQLHVVDVANPAAPLVLFQTVTAAAATTVRVESGFAYLCEPSQVEVFDVDNPVYPESKGVVPTDSSAHIDVGPGTLYVAGDTRFETFSLSTPSEPRSTGSVPLQGAPCRGVRVRGTRAVVLRGDTGVTCVDVADPARPAILGTIATSGSTRDADAADGLWVVSCGSGLCTIGAGTPAPSGVVASYPWESGVDAVLAFGDLVFATTSQPPELVVFDVGDPLAPTVLGRTPLATNRGEEISRIGDVVFVAERGGMHAYDVSVLAAPHHLGGEASAGQLWGVATAPGAAFAVEDYGVGVYDTSLPDETHRVATRPLTGGGQRIAYDGAVLAAAAGPQGLVLYDATAPLAPVPVRTLALTGAMDVVLRPPFAFVSHYDSSGSAHSLQAVDYSSLGEAAHVGTLVGLPGMVDRLAMRGEMLYASAWLAGVNVVDVSNPRAPRHVGTIPVDANIRDLDVHEGWLYVADGFPGGALRVLRAIRTDLP